MTTTVLTAADRARHWVDDVDFEVRFLPTGSRAVQAVALAEHPLAKDVSIRVSFTGGDRPAALAGLRSELRALAERIYADEDSAARRAASAREAYLYNHDVRGMARVRRALIARGASEPDHHEIQRAWLARKIDRGHEDHTVGEIADEVLDARRRLAVAAAAPRVKAQPFDQYALL